MVTEESPSFILGFATLTACEIESEHPPASFSKKYPAKIPDVKIGRLAISKNLQQQGLGEQLMIYAMHQAIIVHKALGLTEMFIDAKDKQAQKYYQKYGFISLPKLPLPLFLPMKSILDAFEG